MYKLGPKEGNKRTFKIPHQMYAAEFEEAVAQRVKDGQGVSPLVREFGIAKRTLRKWLNARSYLSQPRPNWRPADADRDAPHPQLPVADCGC